MSSWWIGHVFAAAIARSVLTVTNFVIGEKLSVKFIPSSWLNPLATNLAFFFFSMLPSCLNLILYIHLEAMGFFVLEKDHLPCIIGFQSIQLLLYSLDPIGVCSSLHIRNKFLCKRYWCNKLNVLRVKWEIWEKVKCNVWVCDNGRC